MKTKYNFLLLFIALLVFNACEDLLTESPDSYYEKENYFVNEENAEMAIIGIYDMLARLEHYGQFEMAVHASDDTYFINGTATDNTRRDIAHYTLTAANQWVQSIWGSKYIGIDRANFAIDGIQSMRGYNIDNKDSKLLKLVAEAKFLRAFLAFDLIKYWGDVPFKTTFSTDYDSAYGPRVDRELIYDQIIEDLNFAKEHLPWASVSTSPERASQGAARGLLMRVLMQRTGYSLQLTGEMTRPDDSKRKEYYNAIIKEWDAFNKSGYHGYYNDGYLELFKSFSAGSINSQESLFEIAFFSPDGSREDSGNWGTYNGPLVDAPNVPAPDASKYMGRANAFFRVVPEWQGFFEESDERRDVMVCDYQYKWDNSIKEHVKTPSPNKRQWYPGKWRREWMPIGYKDPNNTDVNFSVLRYSDVVLLAAEAYNELDDTADAWSLLNSVRDRAGATAVNDANYTSLMKAPKVYDLPFIDDASNQGKFRTALYWERAFELAFEGQRKFDLIRWGFIKEAMLLFNDNTVNAVKSDYPAGQNFIKGKHELLPIPLDEIQINFRLQGQNNPQY